MELREARERCLKINRQVMCAGTAIYFLTHLSVHYQWLSPNVGLPIAIVSLIVALIFGLRGMC